MILALLVIGGLAAGAVMLKNRRAASGEQEDSRAAVVQRGTLLVSVSGSGSVEPLRRVNLTFEGLGTVAEVAVQVGDRVQAGDLLARLDDDQLALQVEQAQAALALAQAQYAQVAAGARPQEIASAEANLRAAESRLAAAAAQRDQLLAGPTESQIAAAAAQVAAAEFQYKATLIAHDRTLRESDDTDERDDAEYELYIAKKNLDAAQAQYDEVLAGADSDAVRAAQANVAAAQAQRDAAQAQLDLLKAGPTAAQLTDARAQVEQAQAALEMAQLALDNAALRAPFDGLVAQVNVTAGELPPPNRPAIVLLDASQYRVSILVDEMDIGQLKEGQTAEVTLDALPDLTLTGTVERVAPAATLEGGVVYYEVEIALDPTTAPIRADMTANATIVVEELDDVLLIPTWAVRVDKDTGQTYVQRRTAAGVERVNVEIGVRYEGQVEVRSGLSEGDVVVLVEESPTFRFRRR
ncbi:MAG TPA: efflux RND transporter periplasmic adaptor subunit [Anaerolineae bacterium]|nr:efflux RND transporter periplasmic adaptor subunit [Anaerolineae bacterium]